MDNKLTNTDYFDIITLMEAFHRRLYSAVALRDAIELKNKTFSIVYIIEHLEKKERLDTTIIIMTLVNMMKEIDRTCSKVEIFRRNSSEYDFGQSSDEVNKNSIPLRLMREDCIKMIKITKQYIVE